MAKGNEFGYWFRCLLHFISGCLLVPSENLVTCYKENGGNAAFLNTACPDFTDDCRRGRVGCLAQMQATRPFGYRSGQALPLQSFAEQTSAVTTSSDSKRARCRGSRVGCDSFSWLSSVKRKEIRRARRSRSTYPCYPCNLWSSGFPRKFVSISVHSWLDPAFPRRAFGKRDRRAKGPRADRA